MALRRPRLVIIDDDARVASMLVEVILTLLTPCSVETASNGETGLAAIRGERSDLVLLDLRMTRARRWRTAPWLVSNRRVSE